MSWWDSAPYYEWEPLSLPFEAKRFPITITHFDLGCVECDRKVVGLRAKFHEYPNCVEVLCGGICYHCRLLTYGRLRWYADGRLLHQAKDGWHMHMMEPVHPVRGFFGRLCKKLGLLLGG